VRPATLDAPQRTAGPRSGATGRCTVVVPVYNEAATIARVVEEIVAELAQAPAPTRVLVLDDGSTDWTPELAATLRGLGSVEVRSFSPNRGKGAALQRVFPLLDDEFTVVIDADGEYRARDIHAVLEPLRAGRADWVLGSRYGFGRPRPRQYLATYLVNRLVNVAFRLLSGPRLHDLLTGLYGFRSELVRGLRLREPRFSYTAELIWKVLRSRPVRLLEVPIGYRFRSYAEGKKIRWWETGTILLAMLRYRFGPRGRP
jgi:glycosyltransferase involved in cell wall biosynthesis